MNNDLIQKLRLAIENIRESRQHLDGTPVSDDVDDVIEEAISALEAVPVHAINAAINTLQDLVDDDKWSLRQFAEYPEKYTSVTQEHKDGYQADIERRQDYITELKALLPAPPKVEQGEV